jgi:cytochrome c oxidase cbb3-type subunit 2
MRYGEYSKAGEFAYDRPFLWGSKRTGPDLARIGGKYPDAWQYMHFENPRDFFEKSNMPEYGWLKDTPLDPEDIEARMDANGFPHTPDELSALGAMTELDALVAYMQVIGTAVTGVAIAEAAPTAAIGENPFAKDDKDVAERGEDLYEANCAACHGEEGTGAIGPSLVDALFLDAEGDVADGYYYQVVSGGTRPGLMVEGRSAKGGMPPFEGALGSDDIWSIVTYIRTLRAD